VSVVDLVASTTVEVEVGATPLGVAVAPDGSRVYVTNQGSHNVSVIDAATNQELVQVPVGLFPFGVAVHPNGSHVYVANRGWGSGSISVIDAVSNLPVTIGTQTQGLFGIGVNPSGTHVYAASEDSNVMVILETATNAVTGSIQVPLLPAAFGMFFVSPGAASPGAASCNRPNLEAATQAGGRKLLGEPAGSAPGVAAAARAWAQCNVEGVRQAAPSAP
jgi:YVTN family beta-propeller protein